MRYIKGTLGHGLHFIKNHGAKKIIGYCDSNIYVCDPDTRNQPLVTWCFHRRKFSDMILKDTKQVSRSSVENEYRALANLAIEIRWSFFHL